MSEQWVEEAAKFGFTDAILIGDSRTLWEDHAARQARLFKRKKLDQVLFITNASFSSGTFQKIIQPALKETLLIIDEVHYAGASVIRKFLPELCPFRLGLSATPERHGDETGTAALFAYFNKIVFSLPIEDAIGKYLANYYYHPIPVELSLEEFREYARLSVRILHLRNSKKEDAGEHMKMLLIKRAKIQNNAINKLEWLRTALHDKPLDYSLFYAGDQIFDEAKKILGKEIGIRIHEFTSRQSRKTRKKLLREFSNQEIQSLIAMKCLDEGVDVPPTRVAYFLASSGNPREFVQRRGRVLRLYPGKEEAIIYDLIAIPPRIFIDEGRSGEHYHAVKSAFAKEYRRVREFAAMSLNRYESMNEMFEMANRLDILDIAK